MLRDDRSVKPARIDIVFPNAYIAHDGIGDHTRALAEELGSRGYTVRILAAVPAAIPGAGTAAVDAWPRAQLRDLSGLRAALSEDPPDLLLVQFEQFSYGRRGFNPEFSALFAEVAASHPHTTRVLYAHETYTAPRISRPLATTAMWAYQRRQAAALVRHAHVVIHSSALGLRRLGRLNRQSMVLAVPSNVPVAPGTTTRNDIGLAEDSKTVVVFGHLDPHRNRYIRDAFRRIVSADSRSRLIYVGKDPATAKSLVDDSDRITLFPNASEEVASRVFSVADIALAPFRDGVSGRRGSFAALLAHGVPTVTTVGRDTDVELREAAAAGAFELTSNRAGAFAEAALRLATDDTYRSGVRERLAQMPGLVPDQARAADTIAAILSRSGVEVTRSDEA